MADHEMICICYPDGHAAAEELRLEVQRRLGVRADQLAMAVTLSLAWQLGAEIEIYRDQWFGVGAWLGNDGGTTEFVACDLPLDGLVYLWKLFADKFPDVFALTGDERDNAATRAISISELAAERDAANAWKAHKLACGDLGCGAPDWRPCVVGKAIWDASIEAASAVDDKWGMPKGTEAFYGG